MKHFNNKDKICFFMGIRNDESLERADRKDFDRNPAWRNRKWISCLPIREWSELHVWLYILKYNLEINSKYRKGYKRVGCGIACPYYTKYTWVLDKYWYKYLFERWHKILEQDFLTHSRWNRLNCTLDEYVMSAWNGGLYRSEPNDEVVQEFMNYKGITDKSIAIQYFNKKCRECDKRINSNEVIGMNLKYLGRDAKTLLCRDCFQNIMEMSDEQWDEAVEGFKAQGCQLF